MHTPGVSSQSALPNPSSLVEVPPLYPFPDAQWIPTDASHPIVLDTACRRVVGSTELAENLAVAEAMNLSQTSFASMATEEIYEDYEWENLERIQEQ